MEFFASLLVGKPLHIFLVAIAFLTGFLTLRLKPLKIFQSGRPLLIASIAWGLYASWEWLVQIHTPEANIRVDLMVIWPLLAIISAWALLRLFR